MPQLDGSITPISLSSSATRAHCSRRVSMTIAGSRSDDLLQGPRGCPAVSKSQALPLRQTSPYSVNRPRPSIAGRCGTSPVARRIRCAAREAGLFFALDRDRDAWLWTVGPGSPERRAHRSWRAYKGLRTVFAGPAGPAWRRAPGSDDAQGLKCRRTLPSRPGRARGWRSAPGTLPVSASSPRNLARFHIVQCREPARLSPIHADDRSVSLHLGPSGLPVKSTALHHLAL